MAIESDFLHPNTKVGQWEEKFRDSEKITFEDLFCLARAIKHDTETEKPFVYFNGNGTWIYYRGDRERRRLVAQFHTPLGVEIARVDENKDVILFSWQRESGVGGGKKTKNLSALGTHTLANKIIGAYLGTPHPLGE